MNTARKIFFDSDTSRISPFWRGHLFLFDHPKAPAFSSQQGTRLLLLFFFAEVIMRPLFVAGARWLTITNRNWSPLVQVSLLTVLVCWLVIVDVHFDWKELPSQWSLAASFGTDDRCQSFRGAWHNV